MSPELFAVIRRAVELAEATEGVRYSHVVDPRTVRALTDSRCAHVIASDAMTADALATALTVLDDRDGQRVLRRFPGVDAAICQRATCSRRTSAPM